MYMLVADKENSDESLLKASSGKALHHNSSSVIMSMSSSATPPAQSKKIESNYIEESEQIHFDTDEDIEKENISNLQVNIFPLTIASSLV